MAQVIIEIKIFKMSGWPTNLISTVMMRFTLPKTRIELSKTNNSDEVKMLEWAKSDLRTELVEKIRGKKNFELVTADKSDLSNLKPKRKHSFWKIQLSNMQKETEPRAFGPVNLARVNRSFGFAVK